VSNPDSFIDEVNEELKRDRLFGAMRKYGWIAVVAVLGIVGAATWNEWRKSAAESQARAFGDAVIGALDAEDPAARREALAGIDATGDRAAIVNLLLGATELAEGDRPGALAALAAVEADPINPQWVACELSSRLPDASIVTADSGTTTVWYARNLRFRAGMMGSVSGTLATMGCAVPYAIAAKFAHPDRPVIALVGDGAMQMNGLGELVTIARYWREWMDPRLVVMVLNNRELAYVTWEERVQVGDPKWPSSQHLPDLPYAEIARLMGLDGERVEDPAEVGPAWDRALAARRPFVLDMVTDPDIPPLPPHITFAQARGFAGALTAGDPAAGSILRKTARSVLSTLLPARD